MYSIKSNKYSQFSEITVDFISDIPNLPTDCYVGSEAFCIENGKTYILNNQRQWIQTNSRLHPGGGGGSPSTPTYLSELIDDSGHRTVSDTEKTTWNGKANASDIPTNNNQLANGAGYQTASDVSTAIAGNQFIVTFSQDSNAQWVCDKTFDEIATAIETNKVITSTAEYNGIVEHLNLVYYQPSGSNMLGNVYFGQAYDNNKGSIHDSNYDLFIVRGDDSLEHKDFATRFIPLINASSPNDINVPTEIAVASYSEALANKVMTINTLNPSLHKYPSEYATVQYVSSATSAANLVVTFTQDENYQWSCNKTFNEIKTAILENKTIIATVHYNFEPSDFLNYCTLDTKNFSENIKTIRFVHIDGNGYSYVSILENNVITTSLNTFERQSNKATTVNTITPSTSKYLSESAIVSYVSETIGSINTILDTINGEVI